MWLRLRRRKCYVLALVLTSSLALFGFLHSLGFVVSSANPRVERAETLQATCDAYFSSLDISTTKFGPQRRSYIVNKVQEARLYGHCFLRHGFKLKTEVADLERKMFPWLTFSPMEQQAIARGRGIIMQLSPQGVNELQRLIWVLEALGNTLPIEVFYKNDVPAHLVNSILIGNQNIKFINVQHLIPKQYELFFTRWANKWLAFLLTSFEEILYLDTDAVPFVNPESFFETSQYLASQSHFFRDRAIPEYLGIRPLVLYRSLAPSQKECDIFGLERPKLGMLTGLKHRMESGVVALNRTKYMPGLVMGPLLQFWNETSGPFWGDKELFWLGQSLSADESYRFSKHNAGTIGKIEIVNSPAADLAQSDDLLEQQPNSRVSTRLCSTKPAHFDDSLKLMWINGGLQSCKFNRSHIDWVRRPELHERFKSMEDLGKAQKAPIEVDGAMIVPRVMRRSWLDIARGRHYGFEKNERLGCAGYFWCAYNTPDHPSVIIRFDEAQVDSIKNTINAWFGQ